MDMSVSGIENHGILSVYVSKAKDLPNLIKLDKQNVMLRLRIAHMTRESDTLFRAGQNPVFKYLEKFEITPSVRPLMYVEVYCERKKKVPLQIGRCEIDLINGMRADSKEGYCKWYELKRHNDEFAGIIFIELTFKPTVNLINKENTDRRTEKMDASMTTRPIPPLPTELGNEMSSYEPMDYYNKSSDYDSRGATQRYMHASAMRQVTPSINQLKDSDRDEYSQDSMLFSPNRSTNSDNFPPNFASSMNSNNTTTSAETKSTSVTTSSETKFHFANLKKLKEKINIFKNPNISNTHINDEKNSVDIEALQKAIGVSSLSDDEKEEDQEMVKSNYRKESHLPGQHRLPTMDNRNSSRFENRNEHHDYHSDIYREKSRSLSKIPGEPVLPPLPTGHSITTDINLKANYPRGHHSRHSSPSRHSPTLPPLSASSRSRTSSVSPTRRRPPPESR